MQARSLQSISVVLLLAGMAAGEAFGAPSEGYYRFPAIHDNEIVFTAEGDLWRVGLAGGSARRLTSGAGEKLHAAISPDGRLIAYSANYDGPMEVYTLPVEGGTSERRTFDGAFAVVVGWTPDGKILYSTSRFSGLPEAQLATIDLQNRVSLIPLSQASGGCYDGSGKVLFFNRVPFPGSHTRNYKGGMAQNLWKFSGGAEAVPLAAGYNGITKDPVWWNHRVYFLSDRDGTMNLWSMDENGRDWKQLTRHSGWDVESPSLSHGRIVYKMGADLRLYDIASGTDRRLQIDLGSDLDPLHERWINKPADYLTADHLSYDGSRLVLLSRGRLFVRPANGAGIAEVSGLPAGKYRDARFLPDGKSLLALSTASGEVEVWKVPLSGGAPERLTDGRVLRWEAIASPDGKWAAHQDKDNNLWVEDLTSKAQTKVVTAEPEGNSGPAFVTVRWSPDSRWITFAAQGRNSFYRIWLYGVDTRQLVALTTDRYNSGFADWSPDGKEIYFLSDRHLKASVSSPAGPRQPEPSFDRSVKIYKLALLKSAADAGPEAPAGAPRVLVDMDGVASRIAEVPLAPGNYTDLTIAGKRMCWLAHERAGSATSSLECTDLGGRNERPQTLLSGVRSFEASGDGRRLLVRKESVLFVFDANVQAAAPAPKQFSEFKIDLTGWEFSVDPRQEFREIFEDAWRLHRDYFYDRNMRGVNWSAIRTKYAPLVERVRDRVELSDVISQMVSELSVLHSFVGSGDTARGRENIRIGALGAVLCRDDARGGYVVQRIYRTDPDRPDQRSPLALPGVDVKEGDVIRAIDGRDTRSSVSLGELLRNRVGTRVVLRVSREGQEDARDVTVQPISTGQDAELRYDEWEFTRRLRVEDASQGRIGYLHLRGMGPADMARWAEDFYPVFDREGLIIDVRHNTGGNIDSWLLERLLRKAWLYWQPRTGAPSWNMPYAFRGHLVVVCDQRTASDGEAFAEGVRLLGLGKLIGVRTWGGGIWTASSNSLLDGGIAVAAEAATFSADGKWLIEGHGIDPDLVVDNLPYATFNGADTQLDAAIEYLRKLIRNDPLVSPFHAPYHDLATPDASVRR